MSHEFRDDATGQLVTETSPVDEAIKMTVVRDMVNLCLHRGCLPRDTDAKSLGSFIPVVSRSSEHKWVQNEAFQLPPRSK